MPWQKTTPEVARVTNQDMQLRFYFNEANQLRFHFVIQTDAERHHVIDRALAVSPLTAGERSALIAALVVLRDFALSEAGFVNV